MSDDMNLSQADVQRVALKYGMDELEKREAVADGGYKSYDERLDSIAKIGQNLGLTSVFALITAYLLPLIFGVSISVMLGTIALGVIGIVTGTISVGGLLYLQVTLPAHEAPFTMWFVSESDGDTEAVA